jgi:hypothetical protein
VGDDNTAPDRPATEARDSSRLTNIIEIGIALIVFDTVIAFFVYTIHRRDCLSARADCWARGFMRNAPVVERQLGHVRNIRRINESHRAGNSSGWYLDYDVSGRGGQGTIVMRIKTNQYDDWDVLSAELEEDQRKPINLR